MLLAVIAKVMCLLEKCLFFLVICSYKIYLLFVFLLSINSHILVSVFFSKSLALTLFMTITTGVARFLEW